MSHRVSVRIRKNLGYRYLSNGDWRGLSSWGRYGYRSRCSDRHSRTERKSEEDDPGNQNLWRMRQDFMVEQINNLKKMVDIDLFGPPSSRGSHSSDGGAKKDEPRDESNISRNKQDFMAERFSDLKRMLDEDPYGVLFGRRLQWTSSPENISYDDSAATESSKSRKTSSVKNTEDVKDSVADYNAHRQQAASRVRIEPSAHNKDTRLGDTETQNEDFEIDAITMRKVPKKSPTPPVTTHQPNSNGNFSIPVKLFTSANSNNKVSATASNTSKHNGSQNMPHDSKNPVSTSPVHNPERWWLAREGFDNQVHKVTESSLSTPNDSFRESRKADSDIIESALDRHIKANQTLAHSSSLKYPPKEITEENVDLLRPSDVRASVGISKKVSKPSADAKQQTRRLILSKNFEKRDQELNRQQVNELAAQRDASSNLPERGQEPVNHQAPIRETRSIFEGRYSNKDEDHQKLSARSPESGGKNVNIVSAANKGPEEVPKTLDARGELQKPSGFGNNGSIGSKRPIFSVDQSHAAPQIHVPGNQSNIHQQILNEVLETQNLIRVLYKRISERKLADSFTAECLNRPKMPRQSLQQFPDSSSVSSSRQDGLNVAKQVPEFEQINHHALSRSIGIYSAAKSNSNPESEAGEIASIPVLYKVLAYDPSTQRVIAAKSTFFTSPASERRLTVAEALSGLVNPAKFLPHFASLQNAGYEIVSSNTNLLIFKKTNSEVQSTTATDDDITEFQGRYSVNTNPIDGTTPQTGNFASPTGFVNYDSILPSPDSEEQASRLGCHRAFNPSDKVRREEPVVSGASGNWRNSHDEKFSKWGKFENRQRRKRRWQTLKRMLWGGVMVTGGYYIADALRGGDYSRQLSASRSRSSNPS